MKRFLLLIILFTCVSWHAEAQKLYVNASSAENDLVGNRFVFQFKEDLRKSATYLVTDSSEETPLVIDIITVSTQNTDNEASAVSVVLHLHHKDGTDYLLQHEILVVGKNRTEEMAADLLADVDKSISNLRALLQSTSPKNATPIPATQ